MMGRTKIGEAVAAAVLAASLAIAAEAGATSMVLQPDGRIVVAGAAPSTFGQGGGALARFDPDGRPDRTFGAGGGVVDFRLRESFGPIALQPSGRIVSAARTGGSRMVRFLPDGGADRVFGERGVAAEPSPRPGETGIESPADILLRGDGEIVVGGTKALRVASMDDEDLRSELQRFGANGDFAGSVGFVPDGYLLDLAALGDGSVIGAGKFGLRYKGQGVMARFVPGTANPFDPGFGGEGGLVRLARAADATGSSGASAVAVAAGGDLVLAGSDGKRALLARYSGAGLLLSGFGEGGVASLLPPGAADATASDVAVQPDGRIVVAGVAVEPCATESDGRCGALFLARVAADGSLDPSFGEGGFARVPGGYSLDGRGRPFDLVLQADGRILVGASDGDAGFAAARGLAVARFLTDGHLDPGFGVKGIAALSPCEEGSERRLRREGCVSSGRLRFSAAGLRGRGPALRLQVATSQARDPLRYVGIALPNALETRPHRVVRRAAVRLEGDVRAKVRAFPHHVYVLRLARSERISIDLPRGLLVRRRPPSRRLILPFEVRVGFADGGSRLFRLRRLG